MFILTPVLPTAYIVAWSAGLHLQCSPSVAEGDLAGNTLTEEVVKLEVKDDSGTK